MGECPAAPLRVARQEKNKISFTDQQPKQAMDKTNLGNITPSGRSVEKLENPPSEEVNGFWGGLLLGKDPFRRSELVIRSSPTGGRN